MQGLGSFSQFIKEQKKDCNQYLNNFDKNNRASEISKSLVYRLYLISAWLNKNRHVNEK